MEVTQSKARTVLLKANIKALRFQHYLVKQSSFNETRLMHAFLAFFFKGAHLGAFFFFFAKKYISLKLIARC